MLTGDLGDNIEGQLRKALDIYRDLPKSSEHLYTTFALGTLSILRGQSHTAEAAVLKGALIEGIAEVNGTVSAIKID